MFLNYVVGSLLFSAGVIIGVWGVRLVDHRQKQAAASQLDADVVAAAVPEAEAADNAPLVAEDSAPPSGEPPSEEDLEFARRLLQLIDQRLDQRNLQVDMLASEMAMSHTLFYERVRRVTGQSPANLLRNRRLTRAREMLVDGQHSVSEVALMCGFSDAKYFSTVFKKYFGVSPSRV